MRTVAKKTKKKTKMRQRLQKHGRKEDDLPTKLRLLTQSLFPIPAPHPWLSFGSAFLLSGQKVAVVGEYEGEREREKERNRMNLRPDTIQESSGKTSISALLTMPKPLCGSQ